MKLFESYLSLVQKKEPLFEGGHAEFSLGGKQYFVTKIDFSKSKEDFPNFENRLNIFLTSMSKKFGGIWKGHDPQFSGSSGVLFKDLKAIVKTREGREELLGRALPEIPQSEKPKLLEDEKEVIYAWIKKFKPSAGDVDIQVSDDKRFTDKLKKFLDEQSILKSGEEPPNNEASFLSELQRKCKNPGDICIVDNKFIVDQVISACAIKRKSVTGTLSDYYFFQCDWEFVEADKSGMPTEFAKLSRSASMKDMEVGVKGREHKYLLRVLANIAGNLPDDITVLKPLSLKETKPEKGAYSFSVGKGIRQKFWDPKNPKERKEIINYYKNSASKNKMSDEEIKKVLDKPNTFVEIPQEKREYSRDVGDLKKKIGVDSVSSFNDLVDSIKKNFGSDKKKIKYIIDSFQEKLMEQLTVNPSKKDKYEDDFLEKSRALKILKKKLIGSDDITEFTKKYNSWRDSVKK